MIRRITVSRIDINMAEANRLLNSPQGEVSALVVRTGQRVKRRCESECPVETGAMRRSHAMLLRVRPFRHVMARVINTDEAALWVQVGTGVYGPRRRPITPKRASVLRFRGKRDGQLLYRSSVAGQPGNPFMLRGLVEGTVGRQVWTIRPGPAMRLMR